VGLSASPCRLDGRGLGEYFGALVQGPSIRELIAQGYLSPFRTFAPPTVDTSTLHKRAGEFVASESEALMDRASVTGSAVGEYRKRSDGKRAIVFCTSIKHSQHVAQEFRDAGYRAVHIDGSTGDEVRDMIIADFERGAIQVLCNVDLCGEGLSVNAIECVILLRPTTSLACFIQQAGRGLRTHPGKKELILLDHVGSTLQFGMLDEPREWALTMDETSPKKKAALSVRVCPACFAANSSRSQTCTNCGKAFEVKSREVSQVEGELVELTAEQIARRAARRDQGRAQSLEELEHFGRLKGHAPGWAKHVWEARQKKAAREMAARVVPTLYPSHEEP
jgi:superfamily II DNA or RNA helicase